MQSRKRASSQRSGHGAMSTTKKRRMNGSEVGDAPVVRRMEGGDDEGGDTESSVTRALKALEKELGTSPGMLQHRASILYSHAEFREEYGQYRTVETLTCLDSPTSKQYIEVHFSYHFAFHPHPRTSCIEWFYTLGYKVFSGAPVPPTDLKIFRGRPPTCTYGMHGWRSIAYAFYDGNAYGPVWRRKEVFSVDLTHPGLLEAHDALWGPLSAYLPDASPTSRTTGRCVLVRTLRVLLASVGIEYGIACVDEEVDFEPGKFPMRGQRVAWMLEAARDRWFARGVRKACGFQLARDADDELKGALGRINAEGDEDEEDSDEGDDDDDDDDDEEDEEEEYYSE